MVTSSRSKASGSNKDYSLPKAGILQGKKNFSRLFQRDAHIIHQKHIRFRFKIVDDASFGCQIGYIVKKNLGKATKRNRMRRLLKEAYRRHRHPLTDLLMEQQITLHGALMAQTISLPYKKVEKDVVGVIGQLCEQLPTMGDH